MKIQTQQDMYDMKWLFRASIGREDMTHGFAENIMSRIAAAVAERYVAEHYQEIAKLIDQQAIATLSVAEGAAAIRETLQKKLPDRIMEVERTSVAVLQRGLFGAVKRVI